MAVIETWLRQDLKGLVTVRSLQGQVFSLDNGGNLIGVKVTKDGKPVTLTGTVTGYCILSDGQTVTVTGSGKSGIQNGNEAYIVLPQLVYSVPGQISIVIKLTSGSVTTTLAACTGYVYRSRTSNEVVPPGTPIPDLATLEEVIRRATAATDAANAATVGAEKVDASMTKEGDIITISVTDRDGNVTEKTITDTADDVAELKSAIDDITEDTENIFDMSVFDGVTGISKDANGYYSGTGQAFKNAFENGVPGLTFAANKQYYFSIFSYTDGNSDTSENNGLQISFYTSDNTRIGRKSVLNSQTTPAKSEVFTTAGNSVSYMTISASNSILNVWHVKDIMLVASSIAVDYLPYVSANDVVARQKLVDSVNSKNLTGDKTPGAYISTQNITVGSTLDLTPVSNTGMGYCITPCQKDDCFVLTTTGLSLATIPWTFIDGNNKVVQYAPGIMVYTEYPLIAPSDGKLVINSAKAADYELIKINNSKLVIQTGEAHFIRDAKKATRWLNKKIVTFGDSRTWYDKRSYTENTKEELHGTVCVGYQEQMRNLMMATVDNQGASGKTSAEICTRIRTFDFTGYDAVFLEGGVNDFVKSSSVTIGEIAPIGSTFDTATVYGAWQSAVEYILTNFPSVLIYMDIPPIAWIHQADDVFPYDTAKIKGEVAALYNIPCLDLYKTAGINVINRDYWYCDDVESTYWRLHFNDQGNALIGAKIAEFMIGN